MSNVNCVICNGKNDHSDGQDCNGNRQGDDISVEAYDAAKALLDSRPYEFKFEDLTENEKIVLGYRAKKHGLNKDVATHIDRLKLLKCLFSHTENRDTWMEKAKSLEKELSHYKKTNYEVPADSSLHVVWNSETNEIIRIVDCSPLMVTMSGMWCSWYRFASLKDILKAYVGAK